MAAPALKDLPKVAVDLKSQLETFSPEKLKDTETLEKNVLPTAEGKTNVFLKRTISSLANSYLKCSVPNVLLSINCMLNL